MSDQVRFGEAPAANSQRDAVHIACIPVIAGQILLPGIHVGIDPASKVARAGLAPLVGIVDPFLLQAVAKGSRFWLLLYPGSITSLRHHWEHPTFSAMDAPTTTAPAAPRSTRGRRRAAETDADFITIAEDMLGLQRTAAREWIDDYALRLGVSGDQLIAGAIAYLDHGRYLSDPGFEGVSTDPNFWEQFTLLTGRSIGPRSLDGGENFFTCSC